MLSRWSLRALLLAGLPLSVALTHQAVAAEPSLGGVVHAPHLPQPAQSGDIVGMIFQNGQATPLATRQITVGMVFQPGQVARDAQLAARISGQIFPVQMDVKATNPDGSVRMAVLTMQQPALAAGVSADVMLGLAQTGAGKPPAVDLSRLATSGYDLTVDLALHNGSGIVPYHIDAAALLAAALKSGTASTWLKGPLATEIRVDTPVAGSLHVTLDIRAYADGSVCTNVQFNNDIAMQASGGTIIYDAKIAQSGHVVVQQTGLQQFQYQTWNQEVWSGGAAPLVNVVHDVLALERAGAILGYDLTTGIAGSLFTDLQQRIKSESYVPLGNAGIVKYMGQTGGRPDIGPATLWSVMWLMTQRQDVAGYVLQQAQAAGSVPWHFWNPASRTYFTTKQYPTLWAWDYRAGTGGTLALTQPIPLDAAGNSVSGWAPDTAHVPSLSYVPYIMTGTRYWLDQLDAQATADILETWPGARHNGDAIVASKESQVRAGAWALRDLVQAAYITPDDAPLKSYFTDALARNMTYMRQQTREPQQGEAYGYLNVSGPTTATWQQNYLSSSLTLAAGQGNEDARRILEWQTNFIAGRFLAAGRGFSPYGGAAYYLTVADATGRPLQSWGEIDRAMRAASQGNDGHSWPDIPIDIIQGAYGVLAGHISLTASTDSMKAFGWLAAHAWQHVSPARVLTAPEWNFAPRLPNGHYLTGDNIHVPGGTPAVNGGNADRLIVAGAGNETIVGGAGLNILLGGTGNAKLLGGPGMDYLFGGSGSDVLYGGSGDNYMEAGVGATTFTLDPHDSALDVIVGYRPGVDRLQIVGTQDGAEAILQAATPDTAGDAVLHLSATHTATLRGVPLASVRKLAVLVRRSAQQ